MVLHVPLKKYNPLVQLVQLLASPTQFIHSGEHNLQ